MKPNCPNKECLSHHVIKYGKFHRKSDGRDIPCFLCRDCGHKFSTATGTPEFSQNKRRLNDQVFKLFASGMSLRRMAKFLHTTTTTVARKRAFMSTLCAQENEKLLKSQGAASCVEFDELETFEHTKCKPLALAMAVEVGTRRILGFEVSPMSPKGSSSARAKKKYGDRVDKRREGLLALLQKINPYCADTICFKSDKCPFYPAAVNKFRKSSSKEVELKCYKGAWACETGQGELKKLQFDPLFSINHTLAMLRANVNRLFRKTWNTTKKMKCLVQHLNLYVYYHNRYLLS